MGNYSMKLKENINFRRFLRLVNECEGSVILMSDQGDLLDLQSELAKYVFAVMASDKELFRNMTVVCESENDIRKLSAFSKEQEDE